MPNAPKQPKKKGDEAKTTAEPAEIVWHESESSIPGLIDHPEMMWHSRFMVTPRKAENKRAKPFWEVFDAETHTMKDVATLEEAKEIAVQMLRRIARARR